MLVRALAAVAAVLVIGCDNGDSKGDGAAPKAAEAEPASTPAAPDEPAPAPAPDPAPTCDTTAVATLAESLTDANARAQRTLVAAGLTKACRLDGALRAYIGVNGPMDPTRPLPRLDPKEMAAARVATCPAVATVFEDAVHTPADERNGKIFDGCDFARFASIPRELFVHSGTAGFVPFYAQQWLGEQGVTAADTKVIALALLHLGRTDYQRPGQTLPHVDAALPPIPEGPVVYVTRDRIEYDERTLAAIDTSGHIAASARDGSRIPSLLDALAGELEDDDQPEPETTVVLVVDAGLPWTTVLNIATTAQQAGYGDLAFVTERAPLEFGALVTTAAPKDASPEDSWSLRVEDDGFATQVHGHALVHHADLDEVAQQASSIMRLFPAAVRVCIDAAPEVDTGSVLQALVTARGPECKPNRDCRPTQVSLGPCAVAPTAPAVGPADPLAERGTETAEELPAGKCGVKLTAVKGALGKSEIRETLTDDAATFETCFRRGLKSTGSQKGHTAVQFVIGPTGKVPVAVVAESDLKDRNAANCMAKAVKKLSFPTPPDETNVVVTAKFDCKPS